LLIHKYPQIKTNTNRHKWRRLNLFFLRKNATRSSVAAWMCIMNWAMAFWTADGLSPEHTAQVLNYLKATGKKIGILVNFGKTRLEYRRVIL
jgi:GxxExxY protein